MLQLATEPKRGTALPDTIRNMINFVSTAHSSSTVVVEISGELSDSSRNYFFECIADLVESGVKHVIVECHKLGHLSSSGLAALLTARKRAASHGSKISLTNINSSIAEVLEITKLGKLLKIYPNTKTALESIEGDNDCVG